MRLRHRHRVSLPQIPLHPAAQLLEPPAVVIARLRPRLNQQNPGRTPVAKPRRLRRQRANAPPHQLRDARVRTQSVRQPYLHPGRRRRNLRQHFLHLQRRVLPVAQQIRRHHYPPQARLRQHRNRLRRMRRQKLQAGHHHPLHIIAQ